MFDQPVNHRRCTSTSALKNMKAQLREPAFSLLLLLSHESVWVQDDAHGHKAETNSLQNYADHKAQVIQIVKANAQ